MLFLFNTTIMTGEGVYVTKKITEEQAKTLFIKTPRNQVISAIGHQSTADAFSLILSDVVEVNRIPAKMQEGDSAIALKVLGRVPEGVILTFDELNSIGFELYRIDMVRA
jgi:hypothetical protein